MKCPTCGIDLMKHPANKCLDAWVAEVIYGVHDALKRYGYDIPHYSRDIACAWEVVEKLQARGYWVSISTPSNMADDIKWICEYNDLSKAQTPVNYCLGNTAPIAICCAALFSTEDR